MKPLKSAEICGTWAPVLLPVEKDNSINLDLLSEQIDILVGMGVDGIYTNGTAGEFFNQTESDFDRISQLFSERCNTRGINFQIGCCHTNPLQSLERVKRAVQLKPGAVQIILPDWMVCDLDERMAFLEKVGDSCGPIGMVLYNPPNARNLLTPRDFFQLKSRIDSLVGCKVGWMDDGMVGEMATTVPGVSLFVPGHHLATGITLGANGAYSNIACLNPSAAQHWYQLMLNSGRHALALEKRIKDFLARYIAPYLTGNRYSNAAADKFLAAVGGWTPITPRLRWPYKGIPDADIAVVRRLGKEALPEFFLN